MNILKVLAPGLWKNRWLLHQVDKKMDDTHTMLAKNTDINSNNLMGKTRLYLHQAGGKCSWHLQQVNGTKL